MFRIGEFSRIAQVSGRLLRYYDKLGLFRPARIDAQRGYRYYSAKQLPELNRILALKELGLTLDEIARLSPQISTDDMRSMLIRKKAQLEQRLREELARLRSVESRIDQIDREGSLRDYEVVLKSIATQPFLATREPATTLATCRAAAQDIGRSVFALVGKKAVGHFVLVIHSPLWEPNHLDIEMGFTLNSPMERALTLPNGKRMEVRELPAAHFLATTVHSGIPELSYCGSAALGCWAEANNFHLAGPSRELILRLPKPDAQEEIVAEIQVPLEKSDAAALPPLA
jgi:DNA-binding transcriptional MerR regulator/effector-binding domain-containing protein